MTMVETETIKQIDDVTATNFSKLVVHAERELKNRIRNAWDWNWSFGAEILERLPIQIFSTE